MSFGSPPPPPPIILPPKIIPPPPMPDLQSPSVLEANRKKASELAMQQGRSSTILTEEGQRGRSTEAYGGRKLGAGQ